MVKEEGDYAFDSRANGCRESWLRTATAQPQSLDCFGNILQDLQPLTMPNTSQQSCRLYHHHSNLTRRTTWIMCHQLTLVSAFYTCGMRYCSKLHLWAESESSDEEPAAKRARATTPKPAEEDEAAKKKCELVMCVSLNRLVLIYVPGHARRYGQAFRRPYRPFHHQIQQNHLDW